MADDPRRQHAGRALALADLPLDALAGRADELARSWAVALVLARPAGRIGEVPLEWLARRAPRLCELALRALESDAELDRLTGGDAPGAREEGAPARELAAIAGARDAAAAVAAVEALRGVLWDALWQELRPPAFEPAAARRVADLADRLAYVCARTLAAALSAMPAEGLAGREPAPAGATGGATRPYEQPGGPGPPREAVIVDERAPGEATPASAGAEPAGRLEPLAPRAEIEIRDERREAGPAAWIGSIGRQLERFERDGRPFTVLLIELERLRRDGPPGEGSPLAVQVEDALAGEIAPLRGSLTREGPGRYWLLAPNTDRAGAERLGERLAGAVGSLLRLRLSPPEVAVGAAVCPGDGREPATLAAHADIELYAARSAARAAAERAGASVDERA